MQRADQFVFELGEIGGAGEAAAGGEQNLLCTLPAAIESGAKQLERQSAQGVAGEALGMRLGDLRGDFGAVEQLRQGDRRGLAARLLQGRDKIAEAHARISCRRPRSLASIASQRIAATSGPPVLAMARIPVGEVTLISVR